MADIEAYSTVIQGLREQSRECKVSSTNSVKVQVQEVCDKIWLSALTFCSGKYIFVWFCPSISALSNFFSTVLNPTWYFWGGIEVEHWLEMGYNHFPYYSFRIIWK